MDKKQKSVSRRVAATQIDALLQRWNFYTGLAHSRPRDWHLLASWGALRPTLKSPEHHGKLYGTEGFKGGPH